MPGFLHGVETIEIERGTRPIRGVRTAVIGLVGTAPIFRVAAADQRVNEPVLITSETDAARFFGQPESGYTIPQALRAIFDQGRGIVIAVNVFDPATHTEAVAESDFTFSADGTVQLPDEGVTSVVIQSQDGLTTYVLDADYTLDALTGLITRIPAGAIAAEETVSITYSRPDPSAVTGAEVIGTVDAGGDRTGLQALLDSQALFGFSPKLLIAPAFCTQATVSAELESKAEQLRAIALIDAPIGTTVTDAIAGRGPGGAINFGSASERVILCYPHLQVADPAGGAPVLEPYSQRLAGVIAARDLDVGFHFSPSNAQVLGIVGIERQLTAAINDPTSETNLLNEAGITTVFTAFGSGFRSWGNRSAAFPTLTHPRNFIAVRRTADILHESVELAMLQFLDQPINDALIDAITGTVNGFIRTLIGRGAVLPGSACTFDPAKNPPEEIAAGHLTFDITFMPPTPAERITFESFIDTSLLAPLGAAGA